MGTMSKIRDIKEVCMAHSNGEARQGLPEEEVMRWLLGRLGQAMRRPSEHIFKKYHRVVDLFNSSV